jgi:hypothetical protein
MQGGHGAPVGRGRLAPQMAGKAAVDTMRLLALAAVPIG